VTADARGRDRVRGGIILVETNASSQVIPPARDLLFLVETNASSQVIPPARDLF